MDSLAWMLLRGAFRGASVAGAFCGFGTMFLAATLLRRHDLRGLRAIAWVSLSLALGAGLGWFLLQTADFASAQSLSDVIGAIPIVAQDTRFGNLLLARSAALILATMLFQAKLVRPAMLIAAGAVIAESWLGHGGAMADVTGHILLAVSIAHLFAGAAWLGALPALRLAIKTLPEPDARRLGQDFSPLGIACVVTLLATATIQYILLIGRPAALFTTAYGLTASAKILLLIGLITLAARNRQVLVPGLPAARSALLRSIDVEIMVGLAVLIAAGVILQFEPPGMVMVQ